MHLIHQNVPGLCWGDPKDSPMLKTNTSRQRLNILGAYNPDSLSFVHLTGEENISLAFINSCQDEFCGGLWPRGIKSQG